MYLKREFSLQGCLGSDSLVCEGILKCFYCLFVFVLFLNILLLILFKKCLFFNFILFFKFRITDVYYIGIKKKKEL